MRIMCIWLLFCRCFLLLLLVAAILWKIKQRYDMYRRRQRLFVEMEQMASRPFSQVLLEVERCGGGGGGAEESGAPPPPRVAASGGPGRRSKRDSPSPIALEPCCGQRAAVLSLLVRLPTGPDGLTPAGHSAGAGLAVASALVTLGNPRRGSLDAAGGGGGGKHDSKCGGKQRQAKPHSQHPDSGCL